MFLIRSSAVLLYHPERNDHPEFLYCQCQRVMHVGSSVCLPWPEAHAYKYTRINTHTAIWKLEITMDPHAHTGFQQAHRGHIFPLYWAAWPGTVRVYVKAPWSVDSQELQNCEWRCRSLVIIRSDRAESASVWLPGTHWGVTLCCGGVRFCLWRGMFDKLGEKIHNSAL